MRRIASGILASLLLFPIIAAAQDYQTGLNAATTGKYEDALKHWRPLAAKNHANAQYQLGLMYRHGRGVKRDYRQAAKWFGKAAEQEQPDSQFALGRLYVTGKGVKKDYSKALPLFRKAAAQGSLPAKINIAVMYRYGKGVRKSFGRALICYLDAGSKGYVPALDELGIFYANGRNVPQNFIEAFKYLSVAKDFGSSRGGRYLKYITKKMTRSQVKEGEALARAWVVDFKKKKQSSEKPIQSGTKCELGSSNPIAK